MKENMDQLLQEVRINDKDTGSPQVQVIALTKHILELSQHIKANHKDHSAKRGLLGMVSRRRRHLKYLARTNKAAFLRLKAAI